MGKLLLSCVTIVCISTACGDDGDTGGAAGTGQNQAGGGGSSGAQGDETGGAGGVGGAAGTSGSAGSSRGGGGGSGGLMIPAPTGTIGSGVACPLGGSATCEAGTACCPERSGDLCVSAFDECACSLLGTCTVMGCDAPDDCPGGRCCALMNPRLLPAYVATSCKADCGSGERVLCLTSDDCDGTDECEQGSQFAWCF